MNYFVFGEKAEEKPPVKKEEVVEEEPVVEEPEEEIDPLDAYMNQIAEVQRVDDLKVKQKQNAEVIYNDETVYDEEDLKVEVEAQPIKNWSLKKKELKFVIFLFTSLFCFFQKMNCNLNHSKGTVHKSCKSDFFDMTDIKCKRIFFVFFQYLSEFEN